MAAFEDDSGDEDDIAFAAGDSEDGDEEVDQLPKKKLRQKAGQRRSSLG